MNGERDTIRESGRQLTSSEILDTIISRPADRSHQHIFCFTPGRDKRLTGVFEAAEQRYGDDPKTSLFYYDFTTSRQRAGCLPLAGMLRSGRGLAQTQEGQFLLSLASQLDSAMDALGIAKTYRRKGEETPVSRVVRDSLERDILGLAVTDLRNNLVQLAKQKQLILVFLGGAGTEESKETQIGLNSDTQAILKELFGQGGQMFAIPRTHVISSGPKIPSWISRTILQRNEDFFESPFARNDFEKYFASLNSVRRKLLTWACVPEGSFTREEIGVILNIVTGGRRKEIQSMIKMFREETGLGDVIREKTGSWGKAFYVPQEIREILLAKLEANPKQREVLERVHQAVADYHQRQE